MEFAATTQKSYKMMDWAGIEPAASPMPRERNTTLPPARSNIVARHRLKELGGLPAFHRFRWILPLQRNGPLFLGAVFPVLFSRFCFIFVCFYGMMY